MCHVPFPLCPTYHNALPTAAGLFDCKVEIRITFTHLAEQLLLLFFQAEAVIYAQILTCPPKSFLISYFYKRSCVASPWWFRSVSGHIGWVNPDGSAHLHNKRKKPFLFSQGQVLQAITSVIKWIGIQDAELLLGISSWVSPSRALSVILE